jgi:hypothetical protein
MNDTTFLPALLLASEVESIHAALTASGHGELAELVKGKGSRSDSDRRYSDAIELWDEGTFDIDDEPIVSEGEDGAYVMVWQWVYKCEQKALCGGNQLRSFLSQ